MNNNEITSDEYRKGVKRERINTAIRSILLILAFIGLIVFVIAVGNYMITHGYPVSRTAIVSACAFVLYIITVGCLGFDIALVHFYVHDAKVTAQSITSEDIKLFLYIFCVTVILVGGSNFLFWTFSFR